MSARGTGFDQTTGSFLNHEHSPLCSPRNTSLNLRKAAWAKSLVGPGDEAVFGAVVADNGDGLLGDVGAAADDDDAAVDEDADVAAGAADADVDASGWGCCCSTDVDARGWASPPAESAMVSKRMVALGGKGVVGLCCQ